MLSKYYIKFTPIAQKDLDEIYSYITNTLYAEKSAEKILINKNSIMRLSDYPLSCSLVDDAYLKSKGYRKLVVSNYIVFYLVDVTKQEVVIMRVLFGRQDYNKLL